MSDDTLPVRSLNEALPYLRRPFTPEALKFKVQSVFHGNSGCLIVAYIDARLVVERLNLVCGGQWAAHYRLDEHNAKLMWCSLSLFSTTRTDVGETPKGMSKDLISDSLKRAAVHFGVGVSVYALAQVRFYMDDAKGRIKLSGKAPKQTVVLTEQGMESLRTGYRKWLQKQTNFGDALDHGDVEGAGGVESEPEEETFVPALPEPLTDERAEELKARATDLRAQLQLRTGDQTTYPIGQFKAALAGAAHSHAELERFVEYLQGRLEAATGSEGSK